MLKAIHAQESKKAAREKAKAVVKELCSMKLKEAAKKVENGIEETLTYCDFPSEQWPRSGPGHGGSGGGGGDAPNKHFAKWVPLCPACHVILFIVILEFRE